MKHSHAQFVTPLVIAALFLFLIPGVSAQVSVSPTAPLSFYFKPQDVLSLSAVNAQQGAIEVYLTASIRNERSDLRVQIKSAPFILNPGLNLITPSSSAYQYEFNANARLLNISNASVLPVGRYLVSIALIRSGVSEPVAIYEYDQEITPLSPPFLISPENHAELDLIYPTLIWSPSLPVDNRYKLLYDIKIVEILQNQTPWDAIQKNFAVYEQQNIRNPMLQYPANAVRLQYEKSYAWQVQAKTDQYYIGETEVFTFSIVRKSDQKDISPVIYGGLSKTLDAGFYTVTDKKLYFRYVEDYSKDVLSFKIINEKGKDVRQGCMLDVKKEPGDNRYMLDLTYCSGISRGFYTLEVSNEKNEEFRLKFKVE